MKNQSGTIKTNLELYSVVMGGSGGYRRLPGGSDHFSLQTNRQTLHHNIYIIIILGQENRPLIVDIFAIIITVINVIIILSQYHHTHHHHHKIGNHVWP